MDDEDGVVVEIDSRSIVMWTVDGRRVQLPSRADGDRVRELEGNELRLWGTRSLPPTGGNAHRPAPVTDPEVGRILRRGDIVGAR